MDNDKLKKEMLNAAIESYISRYKLSQFDGIQVNMMEKIYLQHQMKIQKD